ncbi:NrdJb [Gammaproteobacteria bacterium 45_16_T64]|nr:NrdJb [Gammaproteobacteria bacterium 45_16_T64]
MTKEIKQKIVGYEVVKPEDEAAAAKVEVSQEVAAPKDNVVQMHEKVERPERLVGSTYKIKTPLSEHALYITINDIILNEDTEHEMRRPFEVFINSKNMEHFQWVLALTRVISAVFRKGGDSTFLVEELKAVFDPRGGYFKKGGKFMPSLVAEIGSAIEDHMKYIGMIKSEEDHHQKAFIEAKKKELAGASAGDADVDASYPDSASLCTKCSTKALVFTDGCMTCLSCGDSKCG